MKKERMVTRTIVSTNAQVMCINTETADVSIQNFIATGEHKEFDKLLKILRKSHETETFKLVAIQSTETVEQLYGMPESKFIEMSEILPPRNI